jgi:hypothetical protein
MKTYGGVEVRLHCFGTRWRCLGSFKPQLLCRNAQYAERPGNRSVCGGEESNPYTTHESHFIESEKYRNRSLIDNAVSDADVTITSVQ